MTGAAFGEVDQGITHVGGVLLQGECSICSNWLSVSHPHALTMGGLK